MCWVWRGELLWVCAWRSQHCWADQKSQRTPAASHLLLWLGWMRMLLLTKKKTQAKSTFVAGTICAVFSHLFCAYCVKQNIKSGQTLWLVDDKKFTCLCLGLLNGSGWFGRGPFGGLSRGCWFGGQWFGSSRAPCSCDWSRRWGRNLLACIQLLLQPLHLLLHPPELLWGRKTQSPTGEPNKQHLMNLLHCKGETTAAKTL